MIYYSKNSVSHSVAETSAGKKIPYFAAPGARVENGQILINETTVVCPESAISLIGKHNQENVCAAITAVWDLIENKHLIETVIRDFKGLPHRLEYLRQKDDRTFYNDSFAATPEAGLAAIEAIEGSKVMIMGGYDRQLNLDTLVDGIMKNQDSIRKIVLMGQSAKRFYDELEKKGFNKMIISKGTTMPEILQEAIEQSAANDTIVLSSGFPSFDMFKNFEDRGEQFKEAVGKL